MDVLGESKVFQGEVEELQSSTLQVQTTADIEVQIATAKRYPRFAGGRADKIMSELKALVTVSPDFAEECLYALPRDGKIITGPSVEFARALVHVWGNCRAGAMPAAEMDKYVLCQGYFKDLERNIEIVIAVRRRITNKHGRRYNDDMIATTAAAGTAIAFRTAVLNGVPKPYYLDALHAAAEVAKQVTAAKLPERRAEAVKYLATLGVTEEQILQFLGVAALDRINVDHLRDLRTAASAIKRGEQTVADVFGGEGTPGAPSVADAFAPAEARGEEGSPGKSARDEREMPSPEDAVVGDGAAPPPTNVPFDTPKQKLTSILRAWGKRSQAQFLESVRIALGQLKWPEENRPKDFKSITDEQWAAAYELYASRFNDDGSARGAGERASGEVTAASAEPVESPTASPIETLEQMAARLERQFAPDAPSLEAPDLEEEMVEPAGPAIDWEYLTYGSVQGLIDLCELAEREHEGRGKKRAAPYITKNKSGTWFLDRAVLLDVGEVNADGSPKAMLLKAAKKDFSHLEAQEAKMAMVARRVRRDLEALGVK